MKTRYVVIYLGGETTRYPAILSLFDKYGYALRRTATDASHKNYTADGPHRYIGEAVRNLMEGHQITQKQLSYDLSNYIKVNDMVPHGELELSPDEKSGNKHFVGALKSFGCWVYIKNPVRRRHKMYIHVKKGIFI